MALSQTALQAVLSEATSQTFLECLTLTHSDMNTIRIVNNTEALTRSSGEYLPFPFEVTAPEQSQESPPQLSITITTVDSLVLTELRKLVGKRERAVITYEVVLGDTPDTVEFGPMEFQYVGMNTNGPTSLTVNAAFAVGSLNDALPYLQIAPSNAG